MIIALFAGNPTAFMTPGMGECFYVEYLATRRKYKKIRPGKRSGCRKQ
jgi:hypothetical protein